MQRPIVDYHIDDQGHWVAELACGHDQHVRHDPPWMHREWVTTASGRDSMCGHLLECVKCDEQQPRDRLPQVTSIRVSLPQTFAGEKPWTSSIVKEATTEPIWVGVANLRGDQQADLVHHGGPHKAVCVYSAIHNSYWRKQLTLPNFGPGDFGENFTVSELTEHDVCIGDTWSIGGAMFQVTQPRQPCWKLARRWNIKDLALQVQQTGFTGWYFRVLKEGFVQRGAQIDLVDRLQPDWTIAAANRLMHHDKRNRDGASQLASVLELSPSWQKTLSRRAATGKQASESERLGRD